jgi:hypothetical protein
VNGAVLSLTSSLMEDFVPAPAPRATARPGRGATKKPAYIDLSEGEDDD